jgi:uncharacterized protein
MRSALDATPTKLHYNGAPGGVIRAGSRILTPRRDRPPMIDELHQPLGRKPQQNRDAAPRFVRARGLTIVASAVIVAGAGAAYYFAPKNPYGGEPFAIAKIEPAKMPEPAPAAPAKAEAPPMRESAAEPRSGVGPNGERVAMANELEQFSGVKVTRNGGGEGGGPLIIQIAPTSSVRLAPAPDKRVTEKGRFGLLPKIGADGARPMDVYARPFVPPHSLKNGAPKIALIVGGVGLNARASAVAIDETPEDVTLAFAPYGGDLETLAARARARGHEILLQTPMEPYDYPQNDPGPHTLKSGVAVEATRDDLSWLLSRFSGYAGVMNFLGARFLADEAALTGALSEIGRRGLYFLDDGTAPQSLAGVIAPRAGAPFGRVDVVIDARGTPQAIDAALAKLETLAREKGAAIGFVDAAPDAIARIARYARDLERRGVALAPLRAVISPLAASAQAQTQAQTQSLGGRK